GQRHHDPPAGQHHVVEHAQHAQQDRARIFERTGWFGGGGRDGRHGAKDAILTRPAPLVESGRAGSWRGPGRLAPRGIAGSTGRLPRARGPGGVPRELPARPAGPAALAPPRRMARVRPRPDTVFPNATRLMKTPPGKRLRYILIAAAAGLALLAVKF